MAYLEGNIIHGIDIPKYLLDSKTNLSQYFIRTLSEYRYKTALVDGHDKSSFTFADILNASFNIANWLKYECGIQKSDIIGILSENSIWYPSLILAIWHIGGISVLFNPMYNDNELKHVFNISKPKMVITSRMGLSIVKDISEQLNFIKHIIPIDIICNSKTTEENNTFVPTEYDHNQTCVILYSSGTTGLPKGVELSHRSVFLILHILNYKNIFSGPSDVLMGLVPVFHGYGFVAICICMSVSSKLIVLKYFNEELFLKTIEFYKISILFAVPPLLIFLAKHPLVDKYDLSCLDAIYSGAAPLSLNIQNEVIKRLSKGKPIPVVQGYGMTELCFVSTRCDSVSGNNIMNSSVGSLMCGMSAKVIDLNNGKTLGPNERGELCFKGVFVMKGYYKNPEATSAIIDSNGWLHTGDVGYYDKDLNFYIVDRIKELIKYKAFQVAPAELESLLLTHLEIEDAAVIGIPNLDCGELPMAFIVKSSKSKLSEKDVVDYVHKQVSAQKRLRGGVQFVNSIPKNPSGKILRRILKDLIKQSKL